MLSKGLEMRHRARIESFNIFGTSGSYFIRKWCIFCEIYLFLTLKPQSWKFGNCKIYSQKQLVDFALKFLGFS